MKILITIVVMNLLLMAKSDLVIDNNQSAPFVSSLVKKSDRVQFYFTSNGKNIIVFKYKGSIEIWDIDKGKPIKVYTNLGEVRWVESSQDNRYFAFSTIDNSTAVLKFFDIENERLTTISKNGVEGAYYIAKITNDSKYLLYTAGQCTMNRVVIWDITKKKAVKVFFIAPKWSRDSLNLDTGEYEKSSLIEGSPIDIYGILISKNSKYIVTRLHGGNGIKIWDFNGNLIRYFPLKMNEGSSMAITPDEKYFIYSRGVFEISTGRKVASLFFDKKRWELKLSNNGKYLATHRWNSKEVEIRDIRNLKNSIELIGKDSVDDFWFSTDSRYLFIKNSKGELKVLDANGTKILSKYFVGNSDVAIDKNCTKMFYADINDTIKIVELNRTKVIKKVSFESLQNIDRAVISSDGISLATLYDDSIVSIWSLSDNRLMYKIKIGNEYNSVSMLFSQDSKTLITNCCSKIDIWDIKTGKKLKHYETDSLPYNAYDIALTKNGKYLLFYSSNYENKSDYLSIFDLKKEKVLETTINGSIGTHLDNYLTNITSKGIVEVYDTKNIKNPIKKVILGKKGSWIIQDMQTNKYYQTLVNKE